MIGRSLFAGVVVVVVGGILPAAAAPARSPTPARAPGAPWTPKGAGPYARIEPKVVLLSASTCCGPRGWPEAERATLRELRAMGLIVVSRPSRARDEQSRRLELTRIARQERAFCALRILRAKVDARSKVDLSLTDRLTRKTLWRTIEVNQSAPGAANLVALRVVELLRASLLELTLRRQRPPPTCQRRCDAWRVSPSAVRRQ